MGGRGLNAETLSAQREEKAGGGERDRLEYDESLSRLPSFIRAIRVNIKQGSMTLYYCQ